MSNLVLPLVAFLLTVLAVYLIHWCIEHLRETKRLRTRLSALREELDSAQKEAESHRSSAQKWLQATETFIPLLDLENPGVVEEIKSDLEADKSLIIEESTNDPENHS